MITFKDAYLDQVGYIHFILETEEDKSFPAYWAFGLWNGAEDHEELQNLLKLAPIKTTCCSQCNKEIKYQFRPENNIFICMNCQCQNDLDLEIISYLQTSPPTIIFNSKEDEKKYNQIMESNGWHTIETGPTINIQEAKRRRYEIENDK